MSVKKTTTCLLAGLCLSPLAAMAQTAPTAGQILQQENAPPRAPTTEAPRTRIEETDTAATGGSDAVAVAGIRFSGNTAFADAELQALVADGIAPTMTLDALDALAARVTRHYRDHGYLVARAWLPPQDISGGTVTIAVLEGRVGEVVLDDRTGLAGNATAPLHRLRAGDAVNERRFEDTLLRLSDLPGVEVKSTLRPGESMGTSDFIVDLLPAARFSGSVDLDNFGNRYAGAERLGASLYWNNPAGLGDQLSLRMQAGTSDYGYARLGYQLPFGPFATRVGAAYLSMHYELGKAFSVLDAHGQASVASAYVQQPLLRGRRASWYAALQYDDKHLHDDIDATGLRSRKTLRNATFSLYGNFTDTFGGGASTNLGLGYTRGELGMDALSALIDRLTARSAGGFGKWTFNLQRQQRLPGNWLLAFSANAQWAEKNLDSSEKMLLGGSSGVRAYPQGEASGDSGHVASLELHHAIAGPLEAFGFYDEGCVHLNTDTWKGAGDNHRRLAGYGLGLTWMRGPYSVQAFAAWKDGTGDALSDKDRSPRLWAQAVMRF